MSKHDLTALRAQRQIPQPDEDESQEEFLDRCVSELSELDEDAAEDVCQIAWEDRGAAGLKHKTHASDVQGMSFVLSDASVDRMGDIITVEGWQLTAFKKNPIALFGHNGTFPIGTWHNVRTEAGALRGDLQLAPEGTSPRIDELRRLVDAGILKAVSVGFRDLESEPRKDADGNWLGFTFKKQELVECSLVSVPANTNALAVAKSLNISSETLGLVFAKHGKRGETQRRGLIGKHADPPSHLRKGKAMSSLGQRIAEQQQRLTSQRDELQTLLDTMDNSNVSDADLQKINDYNATIERAEKHHAALVQSEQRLGQTLDDGKSRSLVVLPPAERSTPNGVARPAIIHQHKDEKPDPLMILVRAGVVAYRAKTEGKLPDQVRQQIYGDDEGVRAGVELLLRSASAPAMTGVTGWAAELVRPLYTDFMQLLMPTALLPGLAARGLALSFGNSGRIVIPTRQRTPTIAGSFVGEGLAIPVRQGAFASQTLVPKKVAVITTFTREMADHSIPAIEGLLREAIQIDTTVAIDSVLIDANPATAVRPAGLLNGVTATTPTAGGGLAALIGDITALEATLTIATYGNLRTPLWLMNPSDVRRAALQGAPNTGIFPFRDEIDQRNTLNGMSILASATVPPKTMVLMDAADFVVTGGEAPRIDVNDVATLHMEDTAPTELATPGTPNTVAAPQRSLFQTDTMAIRMIMMLNWLQRRAGTVAHIDAVTW